MKAITGIRRCGKSYLLWQIFRPCLLEQGVADNHILSFELEFTRDIRYRDPLALASAVRDKVANSGGTLLSVHR